MRKALTLFFGLVLLCHNSAHAMTVKKAAPVATKESSSSTTTASLVPTVMSLVAGIQQLNAKQNEMTAECIPTAAEINFVNNTMKEWAKTGVSTAEQAISSLRMRKCPAGMSYASTMRMVAGTNEDGLVCVDTFNDQLMIWNGYPMASKTTYCADGSMSCGASNQKTASNIYNIFNLIDFSEDDYTKQEATMAAALIAKIENCSDAKLSAKKRAMWGQFLTDTISNMGQSTNTGAIMQQVSGISSSGLGGAMQSLGGIATQFMDK